MGRSQASLRGQGVSPKRRLVENITKDRAEERADGFLVTSHVRVLERPQDGSLGDGARQVLLSLPSPARLFSRSLFPSHPLASRLLAYKLDCFHPPHFFSSPSYSLCAPPLHLLFHPLALTC